MKSLADLKRDLSIGKSITLLNRYGQTEGKNIGIPRFVVKKNTVGIYLNPDKTAKKGTFLDYPKASLLEYDGKTIKIFVSGQRPLTDEEKTILLRQPQDKKQSEIDMLSDGSVMFYRQKRYFKESGKYYLFGTETQAGKRLISGSRATFDNQTFSDWFIDDDNCKGEIGLVYEVN